MGNVCQSPSLSFADTANEVHNKLPRIGAIDTLAIMNQELCMSEMMDQFEQMRDLMGQLAGFQVIHDEKLGEVEAKIQEYLLTTEAVQGVIRVNHADDDDYEEYVENDFSSEYVDVLSECDEQTQADAVEELRVIMVEALN